MNPQVRTGLTHAGTAIGGAVAAVGFLSQHQVDLYAAWNALNVIVADITKFLALITPIATAAYGVYKTSTTQRLNDLAKNPDVKAIVTTPAIADSIDSNKVVSTADQVPPAAKV